MDVAVYLQPIFHLHIEPLRVPPKRYHNLVVILVVSNRNQKLEHIICNWIIIITSDHITTFKIFVATRHAGCLPPFGLSINFIGILLLSIILFTTSTVLSVEPSLYYDPFKRSLECLVVNHFCKRLKH